MVPTAITPVIRSNQLFGRIADRQPRAMPRTADQPSPAMARIRVRPRSAMTIPVTGRPENRSSPRSPRRICPANTPSWTSTGWSRCIFSA